jgi:hypothetical protein
LGVEGRTATEGTRRGVRAAAEKGAARQRGQPHPPEQVERQRQAARARDQGRFLEAARGRPNWSPAELRLLGKLPDAEVAARTGRSASAVKAKRWLLGIPAFRDRRREPRGGTQR